VNYPQYQQPQYPQPQYPQPNQHGSILPPIHTYGQQTPQNYPPQQEQPQTPKWDGGKAFGNESYPSISWGTLTQPVPFGTRRWLLVIAIPEVKAAFKFQQGQSGPRVLDKWPDGNQKWNVYVRVVDENGAVHNYVVKRPSAPYAAIVAEQERTGVEVGLGGILDITYTHDVPTQGASAKQFAVVWIPPDKVNPSMMTPNQAAWWAQNGKSESQQEPQQPIYGAPQQPAYAPPQQQPQQPAYAPQQTQQPAYAPQQPDPNPYGQRPNPDPMPAWPTPQQPTYAPPQQPNYAPQSTGPTYPAPQLPPATFTQPQQPQQADPAQQAQGVLANAGIRTQVETAAPQQTPPVAQFQGPGVFGLGGWDATQLEALRKLPDATLETLGQTPADVRAAVQMAIDAGVLAPF
jgi:hypothetical protein